VEGNQSPEPFILGQAFLLQAWRKRTKVVLVGGRGDWSSSLLRKKKEKAARGEGHEWTDILSKYGWVFWLFLLGSL
jgi:hypothetical protein